MFSLARVLVPIDFSKRSMGAASYAIPLAEHFHSEIHLVHVLPPFDDILSEDVSGDMMADRRERAQKQLDNFLNAALRHLKVRRILLDGDPASEIVDCGRRESSDLIMMSTHGYGTFHRALLGSVTAKVLHDTDLPVWTGVHLDEGPPVEWGVLGHVACAVDFNPYSEKSLDWGARLAGEFKAALSLIHVVPRLDSPGEAYYSEEYRRRTVEAANDNIAQLQRKLGTNADALVVAGEIAGAACAAAERVHADLLVIGRALVETERLSTQAYAIIRKSPCPVVSV